MKKYIYIFIVSCVILLLGAFLIERWLLLRKTENLLRTRSVELQEANLELGRAKTQLVELKDLQSRIKELDKELQKEIKSRRSLIQSYAQLEFKYEAEKKNIKIQYVVIDPNIPVNEMFVKLLDGTYKKIDSLAWTYNDFRITISGDVVKKELNYKLHQKFRGEVVETKLPGGEYNHYAKFFELDDKGKDVGEVQLTNFKVLKAKDQQESFNWWNPKLDIGLGIGINQKLQVTPVGDFGISFMSYGKTEDDIKYRLIRIGAGISSDGFSLTGSPVQLNIGKFLPLVSNLWITPYAGYSFGNNSGAHIGIGLSVVY